MTTIGIRAEVLAFALAMEEKLRANDHKPHWRTATLQYLSMRLSQEREELRRAIDKRAPHADVSREAADVANFAMMIADVYAALRAVGEET